MKEKTKFLINDLVCFKDWKKYPYLQSDVPGPTCSHNAKTTIRGCEFKIIDIDGNKIKIDATIHPLMYHPNYVKVHEKYYYNKDTDYNADRSIKVPELENKWFDAGELDLYRRPFPKLIVPIEVTISRDPSCGMIKFQVDEHEFSSYGFDLPAELLPEKSLKLIQDAWQQYEDGKPTYKQENL